MIRFLIFGILAFAGLSFIISQLVGFTVAINRISRKVRNDFDVLREELKNYNAELVPLDRSEIELFSLIIENQVSKSLISKITKGHFSSIYSEALISFAHKDYPNTSEELIIVNTTNQEFIYYVNPQGTTVLIDDREYAMVDNSGVLRTIPEKIELGRIEVTGLSLDDVYVNGTKVAKISDPSSADLTNNRAFSLLKTYEDTNEKALLALSFLYLVQKTVD
jgi:hypothetical protein